jgi:hypothetical protein
MLSFGLRNTIDTNACLRRKATYCFFGLISISLPRVTILDFNSEYISLTLSSTDLRWSSSLYTLISSATFLAATLFLAMAVIGSLVDGDFSSLNTNNPLFYL